LKKLSLKQGLVIKTTGSWHTIKSSEGIYRCKLKGNFRIKGIRITNPVAAGDIVFFEITGEETGIINKIQERKNYIIRKATNLSRESHIIAANIDQAILMISLKEPETPLEFIDRFLLSAEAYHINPIILVNKTDIYEDADFEYLKIVKKIYEFAGYACYDSSVKTGNNIDFIKNKLINKISLIAGNSGVGKSSLINLLYPGLNLKTAEISSYHLSGKHTTTYPEMIELREGGYIIDSPGIKSFGITHLDKSEINLYFNDIFRISKDCKFYNCTHLHEPDCAVINAVKKGILHESRYRSYVKIFLDKDQKYRTA